MTNHLMKSVLSLFVLSLLVCVTPAQAEKAGLSRPQAWLTAQENINDLRLSTYATASRVREMAEDPAAREEVRDILQRYGVTRIYLEVYRSGVVLTPRELITVRDFFQGAGVSVVGGIATVPGGETGVPANAGLSWFNWQDPKTQNDLAAIMRDVAPVFDTFIVDDFLCTGDLSEISDAARGDRSWADYRRDLMTAVSEKVLIGPAKEANPDLHIIVKYPQWYDRFHLFGYDVERFPDLYDEVWVGTETRGQYTQRFGFTQPYEGFVNYRWLAGIAGEKIGGAWFDYGDCDGTDFVEQAWQTVLAGANEIVLFNLGNVLSDHPGTDLLAADFPELADLARAVKANPVVGVAAYKPPHSDAGTDSYIMDVVGMLGVPIVPTHTFPMNSQTIFLPTQAAKDPDIAAKIDEALKQPRTIVFTTGFLATAAPGAELWMLAGLTEPVTLAPGRSMEIVHNSEKVTLKNAIGYAANLKPGNAEVLLEIATPEGSVPWLTAFKTGGNYFAVLNCETHSQADFDAVGEVLLSPRQLGMLEIPDAWANTLRQVFNFRQKINFTAPARVSLQPLANGDCVVQNYNFDAVTVSLRTPALSNDAVKIPARDRVWIRAAGM